VTNVVERAEGNAFARRPRPRSPLTIFHLHRRKKRKGERVLSTSPRDSLPREALSRRHRHQAERISSRIVVPESSLPPQPLSRTTSPPTTRSSFFVLPSNSLRYHWFALRRRVRRAAFRWAYFPARCDRPLHNRCAVTRRGRGREKDYGVGWGDGRIVGNVSGLDKSPRPADRYACPNERVGALSSWLLQEPATVCDKITWRDSTDFDSSRCKLILRNGWILNVFHIFFSFPFPFSFYWPRLRHDAQFWWYFFY